jgi:hypothetical protein
MMIKLTAIYPGQPHFVWLDVSCIESVEGAFIVRDLDREPIEHESCYHVRTKSGDEHYILESYEDIQSQMENS